MRFADVHALVDGVPHMTAKQARTVYDFLVENGSTRVLELGFAHGVSTCIFAAAMEETGGHVTTIDRVSARDREPNIWELLERTGLTGRVTVVFEDTSYTWALMRYLEQTPMPRFDFVYVDGAHLWDVDGFAFSLVDQLLEPGGWILFDDLDWSLARSPSMSQLPQVRALPKIQQQTSQVRKVFELLVMRHPGYGDFRDGDNWGWARKRPESRSPYRAVARRASSAQAALQGSVPATVGKAARRVAAHLPPPAQARLKRYRRAVLVARNAAKAPASQPPAKSERRAARKPQQQNGPEQSGARAIAKDPTMSRLELRRAAVFATADPAGTILEIGPAHNAIFPRRDGYRTKNVDYLDREGLIEKYRELPKYSPDDIEDVDFVIPPGAHFSDVIKEQFDVVLASHVIEHTTSLVHFIRTCTELLAPGGVLALVVPDKRWTFDRFRERSALGRIVDAWHAPPPVHTVGTLADFTMNAAICGRSSAWSPGHRGLYAPSHDLAAARNAMTKAEEGSYVDVHNWVFTPNHFRLILSDLWDLELIKVREAYFRYTVGHEFFVNLTVDGPGPGLSRPELVTMADRESAPPDKPQFVS